MSLLNRIARKIARRFRTKGTRRTQISRRGRNWQSATAVDLWERVYRFREKPAARAGTKRRIKREKKGWAWL